MFQTSGRSVQPNPRISRRRSIVREFALNTSSHGIPGIARSQSLFNRLFWTISLLSFSGILMYFVTESCATFLQWDPIAFADLSLTTPIRSMRPNPIVPERSHLKKLFTFEISSNINWIATNRLRTFCFLSRQCYWTTATIKYHAVRKISSHSNRRCSASAMHSMLHWTHPIELPFETAMKLVASDDSSYVSLRIAISMFLTLLKVSELLNNRQ